MTECSLSHVTDHHVDPYFYLMVWSILMMNLHDLSVFFWQHCKVCIPNKMVLRKSIYVYVHVYSDFMRIFIVISVVVQWLIANLIDFIFFLW